MRTRAACITRVGRPGRYEYVLIEGREHWPISFVSETTRAAYLSFVNSIEVTGYSSQEEVASPDNWLKANTCNFEVSMPAKALSLSLALPTLPSSSSLDGISALAIAFALGAFGHELMIQPGGEALYRAEESGLHNIADHQVQQVHEAHEMHGAASEEEQENRDFFLHAFEQVLAKNPDAVRFIIIRDDAGKATRRTTCIMANFSSSNRPRLTIKRC
ncbi:MAG: hypothetical protein ACH346_04215 [Chthoniobacterales bacterium]